MNTQLQSAASKPSWVPHDYQKRAIRLLLSQSAGGLFLDPGLGKTSICLAALKILKSKGFVGKTLIIAPLRPMYKVWPDEIEKWADFEGITYSILHGNVKEHNLRAEADVYLINPEGLQWLFNHPGRPEFDCLIIDESTKFKDTTTKRFRLLKKVLPSIARRWILTGTPVPNGISDLFGQIYILDEGGALGRFITHFRNTYFVRSGYNLYDWAPRPGAFEEIVGKISPFILQLSANDYLEMPDRPELAPTVVELPELARKRYNEVEEFFITAMEDGGNIVAGSAAVAGIKCRQMANGAVYDENRNVIPIHEAKLDALEDLIEELAGAPTLVMYEFQHDAARIMGRLGKLPTFGSGLSAAALDRLVDDFNAGILPVVLGHPASMGHGLNLQKSCNHIIWFGIPWNLEHYDQANARIFRQGQRDKAVYIYHIVARDTLDERVVKVLQSKSRAQQTLLSSLGESGAGHTIDEA